VSPRLLIIGLDGADPALLSRFIEDGTTPNLGRLAARGLLRPLRSTTPPVTFPAWASFLTGTDPSTHGIPDFTIREGYRVRFAGAADCAVPTFFEHLEGLGLTCGVAWFPVTYPPRPLRGYHLSGWDSPVTAGGDPSFVHPRSRHDELRAQFGADHLEFDTVDEFREGEDWYLETAAALPRALARRARVAAWLLEHRPVDVAAFYFGETDTVAHHFWAFHDPTSPRRPARFPAALGSAVADVYRAADDAVGLLLKRIDDGCPVLLLSDHGSGGSSDVAVHLNRALERAGLLRFASRSALSPLATFLRGRMVGAPPAGCAVPCSGPPAASRPRSWSRGSGSGRSTWRAPPPSRRSSTTPRRSGSTCAVASARARFAPGKRARWPPGSARPSWSCASRAVDAW
jgi:predicted AlkP superfamily phosphohydrolase/phosphomutase